MKKRLFITMILGLAFTPSAYAFDIFHQACPSGKHFDGVEGGCEWDDDGSGGSAPSNPSLTVQCPLLTAASQEAKNLPGDPIDSGIGGGHSSAGVAGF